MKNIIHYVSIAAIAFLVYIFTFYIDGEMGVILFAFLIIAPLTSMLFTVYARKRMKISLDCDAYVPKGSSLSVNVTIEKTGFFPFAVIEIKPSVSAVFGGTGKVYRLSMLSTRSKSFTFSVDALVGGNGSINLESVYSCGFLGFLRLKVKQGLPEVISVGVIPDIPDVKTSSQLYRSVSDAVVTSDEEEENDSSAIFSANTAPGYEHREYVQGDPLKRINWKLSTKKSKLMVRLDEAVASVQPIVILDLYRKGTADEKAAVLDEEQIIRSAFGLASTLVKHGISCRLAYRTAFGDVAVESIDSPAYPEQLLLKVLSAKVETDRRIDVSQIDDSVCACMIATTDAGGDFTVLADKLGNGGNVNLIGVSVRTPNATSLPLWYLDEDNNFKLV